MALSRYHAAASRPLSVQEITGEAEQFEYDPERPLLSWLRSAKMLLSEAAACETEGNLQMAYLYLYRHAELVLSKLSRHPDAKNAQLKNALNQARKQVNANFAKLESWKPKINRDYERYVQSMERRRLERNQTAQQKDLENPRRSVSSDGNEAGQRRSLDVSEYHQLAVDLARQEIGRRHGLHQPRRQQESQSSSDQRWQDIRQLAPQDPTAPPDVDTTVAAVTSYPQVRKPTRYEHTSDQRPSLPPKLVAEDHTLIDVSQYRFKAKAYTEAGAPLRTLVLPADLTKTFLNVAHSNTARNLETCGVLCATTISNALFVSHLVIPDQNSTSDTCDATEEGDIALFDYCDKENLLVCGWIHTHPSQTCFLSSRDLHTSSGYQQMLPEAIAIVCAPRHAPDFGIFRLTNPPGLPAVLKCTQKGLFHPHAESNLYTDAAGGSGHVIEGAQVAFKMVDLRGK